MFPRVCPVFQLLLKIPRSLDFDAKVFQRFILPGPGDFWWCLQQSPPSVGRIWRKWVSTECHKSLSTACVLFHWQSLEHFLFSSTCALIVRSGYGLLLPFSLISPSPDSQCLMSGFPWSTRMVGWWLSVATKFCELAYDFTDLTSHPYLTCYT